MASDSVVDERTLREIYLTGFEIAVREGKPRAIMSAYNLINGVYAHENSHLLKDILRDEWGFDGAVISDWGGGNDAVAAVANGGTLEMPSPGLDSARQIVEAVEAGLLSEADLDARVAEMIALIEAAGPAHSGELDVEASHSIATRVAARSVVLLKNEGDILPLAPHTKVAVVGDFAFEPRFQGAGSSLVNPTKISEPWEALLESGLDVLGRAKGFVKGKPSNRELIREAVDLARQADVVLAYIGLDEIAETEGKDRDHLRVAEAQVELLAALKAAGTPVVAVISAGAPIEMPWLGDVDAVLHGYLGGQAGAPAMVKVITGASAPMGRLAETYPVSLSDHPTAGRFPSTGRDAQYREGVYVGYRYFSTANVPVLFPFGFGLQYTTFSYDALEVSKKGVTVTVTNTGTRDGAEVVQLYVRHASSALARPDRELKGFARVELAPGQSGTVTIPFDEYTFRVFDAASNTWVTETGEYTLLVGANIEDIRLEANHKVTGVVLESVAGLERYNAGAVHGGLDDAEFELLLGAPLPAAGAQRRNLGLNDPLAELVHAPSALARAAGKAHASLLRRSIAKGKPDLNLLFQAGMPFRAIAKMTNGMVSMPMVEALLMIVNGRFFAGIGAFVREFRQSRRLAKELQSRLDNPSLDAVSQTA